VFLPCEDISSLSSHTRLKVRGGSVECSNCDRKLGRYFRSDSNCACGVPVPGPVAKIAMAKLDRVQHGVSVEELLARSRAETEIARDEHAMKMIELKENDKEEMSRKASKRTGRQAKSHNKSTYSEFRNKPNK